MHTVATQSNSHKKVTTQSHWPQPRNYRAIIDLVVTMIYLPLITMAHELVCLPLMAVAPGLAAARLASVVPWFGGEAEHGAVEGAT